MSFKTLNKIKSVGLMSLVKLLIFPMILRSVSFATTACCSATDVIVGPNVTSSLVSSPSFAPTSIVVEDLQWTLLSYSTLITPTSQFSGVGSSASGQYIVLANATGRNLGTIMTRKSWNNVQTGQEAAFGVSVSSNTGYYISYLSNLFLMPYINYGASSTGYAYQSYPHVFVGLDMSDNGIYQYLQTYGTPYNWSAITCSGDGSNVYAAMSSSWAGAPLVFYSSNYALFKWTSQIQWTTTVVGSASYTGWIFMTCSDSGQYVAGINQTSVYISSDYGLNYTQTYTARSGVIFSCIAMSSSGQYLFLATSGAGVLYSSQFGILDSWESTTAPLTSTLGHDIQYGQIVSNPTGNVVIAVTLNKQGVYTTGVQGQDGSPSAAPSLSIAPSSFPISKSPSVMPTLAPSSILPVSAAPTATPTVALTAVPSVTPTSSSVFDATQIISGISYQTYLTNTSNYDRTISSAVAETMTGVTSQNVLHLAVTEYIAPTSIRGRLLADSTQISAAYVVSVSSEQVPGATYTLLSNQLTQAVTSGTFNSYLTQYAVEFGATGMYSATSSSVVTTNDVVVIDDNGGGGGGADGLSTGASIGVVIGVLAVLTLMGGFLWACMKRDFVGGDDDSSAIVTAAAAAAGDMSGTRNELVK